MKMKTTISMIIIILFMMIILPTSSTAEGGLLPSLTETVGVAMPSLGEALGRYPDEETENEDGSITELYTNVSESDFNVFSVYLQQMEAELADYKVEKGILTAEIRAKGAAFSLSYNSKSGEVEVIYPSGTFDEWDKNAKTHFDTAQKLLAEGKMDEACVEIFAIPQFMEYGPVDNRMKEDKKFAAAIAREAKYAPFKEVGNFATFGTYPQTKEGTDQTPIEWIVLVYDETNHKTLLISKYGLDAVPYNTEYIKTTWERCTLRIWLNDEFLKKAFSAKEQSAILVTNVDNSSGQEYSNWGTNGGNNTQDRIFLLSYAEVNCYLSDRNNTNVAPTEYAIAQGAWTSERSDMMAYGKRAGRWWLRSPGEHQSCAALVGCGGTLSSWGVVDSHGAVRPALWLNLDSDLF